MSHHSQDGSMLDSLNQSLRTSMSSEDEDEEDLEQEVSTQEVEIDVKCRRGEDVSLNIHDQLNLGKLQQLKGFFFPADHPNGKELHIHEFTESLRLVLTGDDDIEDEDLTILFMKVDANNNGGVDWDEFTGFLLQLDEGNRSMVAAAAMVDLTLDRSLDRRKAALHEQHRGMIEKVINVERPGLSAYVTCGRDGTIRFWHKSTLAHMRSINHLDTIKASFNTVINESKGRDTDGKRPRNLKSAAVARAVNEMRKSWVCDIEQMALSNRLAVACMDRTIEFYDMHTGEPVCRISGLKYPPNCLECVQLGPDDQLVIIGDMGGYLHFWKMGKHFYIPDPNDVREAFDLRGRRTVQIHTDAVLKVKYIPDLNAAVTCSLDGLVSLVDLDKRKVLRSFTGHVGAVFDFDYCKKHRFMASVGMGREVVFWNPYTMDVLARGNGHGASVVHCIVDDDNGRIITVSLDKMVMCWDSGTCTCIQCFKEHRTHRPENSITAALWDSQRSALILAGSRISVWRNKGVIHVVQRSHEAPVAAALINERFHQVVSGDAMSNIHVWSIDSGQLVFRFGNAHGTSKISSMCFDASERRLVTGANDGTVFMWNFSNGKVLREYSSQSRNSTGDSREISGVAYCVEIGGNAQVLSEYLATSSWDRRVRIYAEDENRSDQSQCQIPSRVFPLDRDKNVGHTDDVLTIVHCGTQQVATGGFDGQVIMWATDGGKVKFKMCPADHDIEVIDAVSSIGGLTSVASLMKKRRKDGLLHDSENSVGSAGRHSTKMASGAAGGASSAGGGAGFNISRPAGDFDRTKAGLAHFDPGKARLSHLSAVRQWQAHETYVSSVQCIDYHGKVNLVVTAGADCNVHLWTLAGAYIGMFGQASGKWGIGSRATWRDPTAHSLLNSGKQDEDDDEDGTEGIDSDEDDENSLNQLGSGMASQEFGQPVQEGGQQLRKLKANGAKDRQAREEEAEKKREECQRYQEKRYYEGSQNRVQKKLLRTRLNAFCMSQDHDKKERQKEAETILHELTSRPHTLHAMAMAPKQTSHKARLHTILRSTYNQVAFQLQLHKHQDVNAQAEKTLVRRKSRRRARGAQNASVTSSALQSVGVGPPANAAGEQFPELLGGATEPVGYLLPKTNAFPKNSTTGAKAGLIAQQSAPTQAAPSVGGGVI